MTKIIQHVVCELVKQKGTSVLVQFVSDGMIKRVFIPLDKFGDGHVPENVLQQGIPYGYPWEEIELTVTFDGQLFANELHNLGIWTADDLLKNPQGAWSALRATLADNVNNILSLASQEKKGVRNG